MIPFKSTLVKVIFIISLLGVLFWQAFSMGQTNVYNKWDKEKLAMQQEYIAEIERLENIKQKVEVRYIDRLQVVEREGKERIKYVPKYITQEDNASCDIRPSFVELHDSAAEGRVPDPNPPSEFDEGVTPPKLSEVGHTVVTNYNLFHEMREQCSALQDWASRVGGGNGK